MKKHFASAAMTVVALTAALLLLQGPADSQAPAGDAKAPAKGAAKGKGKGKARPTGPTPRMADGKPDFSGNLERRRTRRRYHPGTDAGRRDFPDCLGQEDHGLAAVQG